MSAQKILVVDDNPTNLKLITYVLARAGYDVEASADVAHAQARLANALPDVILLDLQMPGIDGLTFAGLLKADPFTAAIPLIAVTAYAMKGDEERIRQGGCEAYLSKPISVATFLSTVKSYLGDA